MLADEKIIQIIEAALLASDGPLTVAQLNHLFAPGELDEEGATQQIRDAIKILQVASEARGVELKRVASGYRFQVRQELSEWVSRLWDEKPPRYTRALLETLALITYKQPVTRGDIEQVRGVSVSQNIMRTLIERGWIKSEGQREVPGRPTLYGTTKAFLDYFNLKSLNELPELPEIRRLIEPVLAEAGLAEAGLAEEPADGPGESEKQTVAESVNSELPSAESSDAETPSNDGRDVNFDDIAGEAGLSVNPVPLAEDIAQVPESAEVVSLHPGADQN